MIFKDITIKRIPESSNWFYHVYVGEVVIAEVSIYNDCYRFNCSTPFGYSTQILDITNKQKYPDNQILERVKPQLEKTLNTIIEKFTDDGKLKSIRIKRRNGLAFSIQNYELGFARWNKKTRTWQLILKRMINPNLDVIELDASKGIFDLKNKELVNEIYLEGCNIINEYLKKYINQFLKKEYYYVI